MAEISFTHADGDLDLELYDNSGTKLTASTSVNNS